MTEFQNIFHTLASSCFNGDRFGISSAGLAEFKVGVRAAFDKPGARNQPRNSLSILDDSVRLISIGHIDELVFSFLKKSNISMNLIRFSDETDRKHS